MASGLWEVAPSGGLKDEGHRGPHGLRWSDCAESANTNAECQQLQELIASTSMPSLNYF